MLPVERAAAMSVLGVEPVQTADAAVGTDAG
jgi:hypothetical protein